MKIYVAAKLSQKMEMRDVAAKLRQAGHEVTATWIDSGEYLSDDERTDEELTTDAYNCLNDLQDSDLMLAFSNPRGTVHLGGGRHVEFGVAHTLAIPIMVVGPRGEHIFHYLPGIQFVETFDDALAVL